MAKRVAIIGAGVAGLTSIKCAIDAGLEPTAYERDSWLGGMWNFTEDEDRFVAPKSTIFNTSKHLSCFSDYPMPKEMPNYLPGKLFHRYLESYAKDFNLTRRIHFDCKVLKVEQCKDYEETGRWEVHSIKKGKDDDDGKDVLVEVFDYVLVCSGGVFSKPFLPDIPGIEEFTGRKIHSQSYKTFEGYEGKRVLVVGLGNTAADIACELSRIAKQVYISTRGGSYVLSRMSTGGRPVDASFISRAVQSIPTPILEMLVNRALNSHYNLANFGLQPTTARSLKVILLNDELPHRIVTGTLIVKDEIVGFKDKKVFFKDETEIDDIDDIIFATGYDAGFPFLPKSIYNPDAASSGHQLYKAVFPVDLPKSTIAFIGAFRLRGPVIPLHEMQARWAMQVFTGKCTLPSKELMMEDVVAARSMNATKGLDKCRASSSLQLLSEGFLRYMDDVGSMIGVKPNLWKLLFQNPSLAIKCFFGPNVPAQYRLVGPGAWQGAQQVIEEYEERWLAPLKTRQVNFDVPPKRSSNLFVWILISAFVLLVSVLIFYK